MEKRELTCINCPMGCALTVTLEQGRVLSVEGNTCKKGEEYGRKEVTAPARILTSLVRVKNGEAAVVSVKTEKDIPKNKIMECACFLKQVSVNAPIQRGQVIFENICNTGVNMIATKNVAGRK